MKPCILIGTTRIITLDKTIIQKLGINNTDDHIYFSQELTTNNEIVLRKISI